jgi:hypothetical protein
MYIPRTISPEQPMRRTLFGFGMFADGQTTSCAIVAYVPDRDAFRAEAIRTMKLPEAPAPELRADGSRSYFWDGALGPGTTVLDRDFQPSGKPGVMLKLLSRVTPAR